MSAKLDLDTYVLRIRDRYPITSIYRRLSVLRKYEEFLISNGLDVGVESLNLWLDELVRSGIKSSSVRVYAYDVLNYFYVMMLDVDDRKVKLTKMRLPPSKVSKAQYLTVDEVRRLIFGSRSPIRSLIYSIAYAYGRRVGEVLALTFNDLDLENDKITFTILKKKRPERVTYDLEGWIKNMIISYKDLLGRDRLFNITRQAVYHGFICDCEWLGIKPNGRKLTVNMLRHSRFTHLRDMGIPLDVISKYLARHSSYDITVQYYLGITKEYISKIPKAGDILLERTA